MAERRGHGDGTIFQSGDRWVAEISLGHDGTGRRRRIRRRARTKTEARAKLRELQRLAEDGLPHGRAQMTVGELVDWYLEQVIANSNRRPPTVEAWKWSLGHVADRLGLLKLTALTASDVEECLTTLRDERKLGDESLKRIKTHLASAIREAQRRDWVARNVAELAYRPKSWKGQRRAMTQEQAGALIEACQGHRLEVAVLLGLHRGLRPGEILGLRWSDLDLSGDIPTVSISQAVKRSGGKVEIGEPKTAAARRTLVLTSPIVGALRSHKSRQARERLRNADLWVDLDLVTATEIGTIVDPANFRREFKKLCQKAGIGDWTPYELRHTAVTLLAHGGVALDELADMAGHTDGTTLLRVYRHRLGGPVDAGVNIASAIGT